MDFSSNCKFPPKNYDREAIALSGFYFIWCDWEPNKYMICTHNDNVVILQHIIWVNILIVQEQHAFQAIICAGTQNSIERDVDLWYFFLGFASSKLCYNLCRMSIIIPPLILPTKSRRVAKNWVSNEINQFLKLVQKSHKVDWNPRLPNVPSVQHDVQSATEVLGQKRIGCVEARSKEGTSMPFKCIPSIVIIWYICIINYVYSVGFSIIKKKKKKYNKNDHSKTFFCDLKRWKTVKELYQLKNLQLNDK